MRWIERWTHWWAISGATNRAVFWRGDKLKILVEACQRVDFQLGEDCGSMSLCELMQVLVSGAVLWLLRLAFARWVAVEFLKP